MDFTTTLLIVIAVGVVAAIFLLLRRKPEAGQGSDNNSLLMLQQLIAAVDKKLGEINEITRSELAKNSTVLQGVSVEMTKFGQTGKQVLEINKELQSFQNLFSNQKKRGAQGEIFLEGILKNILPAAMYKTQYAFKNGDIVDAIVFLPENRILPIDSKFPRDNYNRAATEQNPVEKDKFEKLFINDLKKRIDEAAKYVRTNENTLPIALMYVPADGIYADLFENEIGSIKSYTRDLMTYAHEKKVIPVSPNLLYAQLEIILHGVNMWQLDKKAIEIRKLFVDFGRHMRAYRESFGKIGRYLDQSIKSYLDARDSFRMVGKDIEKITEGEVQVDAEEIGGLERPMLDE